MGRTLPGPGETVGVEARVLVVVYEDRNVVELLFLWLYLVFVVRYCIETRNV